MSAHIEFDFNDDGTITMMYRRSKDSGEIVTTTGSLDTDNSTMAISVCAGETMEQTHVIFVGEIRGGMARSVLSSFGKYDQQTGVGVFVPQPPNERQSILVTK